VNEAAEIISKTADADANIIFGTTIDENLSDEIKITVIATGFDEFPKALRSYTSTSLIRPQHLQDRPQPKPAKDSFAIDGETPSNPNFDKDAQKTNSEPDSTDASQDDFTALDDEENEDEFDIPAFLRQSK
jgi:cell division protein FtsZ